MHPIKRTNTMKTKNFILLVFLMLLNVQAHAQVGVTKNGKRTSDPAEVVSANGAIGTGIGVGRDGNKVSLSFTTSTVLGSSGPITFLAHNLGADTNLPPDIPVQGIHGNYYQWGRKTEVADAYSSTGAISSWNTTPAANNAWLDDSKGTEDPCPTGFKVPTAAQWQGVIGYNTKSVTGNWINSAFNFGSAIHFGSNTIPKKLTLPAAGYRSDSNGQLGDRGIIGDYWSSSVENATFSEYLRFNNPTAGPYAGINSATLTTGYPVRCVAPELPTSTVSYGGGQTITFLAHNLGADTNLPPDIPVQGIHGNYYQWGRKTEVADAYSSTGAISSWNTTPAANNAWLEGSKGTEDPCPTGFKVPTTAQWQGVLDNNTVSRTGNWTNSASNFSSAIHFGSNTIPKKLTLPASGFRREGNGELGVRGSNGYAWTSSVSSSIYRAILLFTTANAATNGATLITGYPVRCVVE
jgi:uncharacterized protein (TIGR02145 family)